VARQAQHETERQEVLAEQERQATSLRAEEEAARQAGELQAQQEVVRQATTRRTAALL
jgi:hypothetical protein